MTTDLTFFTNEPDAALLDRFKATLRDVQFSDVLVGYFRTSGFHLLADALAGIEEIRILAGLGVDRQTLEIVEASGQQLELAFQIHAKVYISRFPSHDRDFGRVITGSSNFSYSGLLGNYEFNVELKDAADVRFALAKFEELWAEAVDISDAYVDTIQRRTWLNDQIPPHDLYLKFLYEYFKEDINIDQEIDAWLPEGFLDLAYQKQAVTAARKILEAYGGVFLAHVVGLGKTFIAALLAQQLPGRKLVICPPVLKDYWQDTLREFGVPARVESMGKLDHILQGDYQRYDVVFVDEAHRFRNEGTPRLAIPAGYYDLLARNKAAFAEATEPEAEQTPRAGGGQSNVRWAVSYLKAIRRSPALTDDDERLVQAALDAFDAGVVPSPLSQRLKRSLERETNPLRAVGILRSTLPASLLDGPQTAGTGAAQPVEVILSEYIAVQQGGE